MTAVAPLDSQPDALQADSSGNKNDPGSETGEGFRGGAERIVAQINQPVANCPRGLEPLLELDRQQIRFIKPGCCGSAVRSEIRKMDEQLLLEGEQVTSCLGSGFTATINTTKGALAVSARREFGCLCFCDNGLRVEAPEGNLIGFVTLKPDPKSDGCFCCCPKGGGGGGCCKKKEGGGGCCKRNPKREKREKEGCCGKKSEGGGCFGKREGGGGGCCKRSPKQDGAKEEASCSCCAPKTITLPKLFVMNADREVVLTINEDKTVTCLSFITDTLDKICPSHEDLIYSLRANNANPIGAGVEIGTISKKYAGRCCPDPDQYSLNMPADLDVRMKTLVVCSVFFMKHLGM